jgi:hypothetical protein
LAFARTPAGRSFARAVPARGVELIAGLPGVTFRDRGNPGTRNPRDGVYWFWL